MMSDVCKHCSQRALSGGLPDRRTVPHRVRYGGRAAGHLQRLRLLRAGLSVRRRRGQRSKTARRTNARCATTGSRAGSSRPAPSPARPIRSSSANCRTCTRAPGGAWPRCIDAGVTAAYLYGAPDAPAETPRSRRGAARAERVLSADRAARDLQSAARAEPAGQPHRSGAGGRSWHDGGARGGGVRIVCRREEWPWIEAT